MFRITPSLKDQHPDILQLTIPLSWDVFFFGGGGVKGSGHFDRNYSLLLQAESVQEQP